MPLESSFLRNVQPVQIPDATDVLKQYLSLRQLADQRRYREQQYRAQELLAQQREQEMAERERAERNLATLPPNATYEQTVQHLGYKYGSQVYKAKHEALEAAGKARVQDVELRVKRNPLIRSQAEAALRELDPEKRKALIQRVTPDFLEAGVITQEQADNPAFDDPTLESIYTGTGGDITKFRGEIAAEKEAREKAARERSKEQLELAGHYFGTVSDTPSLRRWKGILPAEMRAVVPDEYTPENMRKIGNMLLTEQQRQQQLPNTVGDFVRIATDPNSTPQQQETADKALVKFREQAKAGAPTTVFTPDQKVGNEAKLRDDFRQESKNYLVIRDAYNNIVSASKSQTGPGDISLVYAYMKLLDPGSTVREGEFATAQNAGGIPERVRAIWNKMVSGERLDPTVRNQFVAEAGNIHGQSLANHEKVRGIYRGIASRSGLDPENVVVDYSTAPVPRTAAPTTGPSTGGTAPVIPLGDVLKIPAGTVENGWQFLGGDPAKKENWQKVKSNAR